MQKGPRDDKRTMSSCSEQPPCCILRPWGFTLMELLITLAVSAVLLAIAVPSFREIMTANRLATAANEFVSALHEARAQAIRGGQGAVFCGTANPAGWPCGSAAPGAVYVMQNGAYGATPLIAASALPPTLQVGAAGVTAIRYGGDGIARTAASDAPYSGLVAEIQAPSAGSTGYRCLYLVTGSTVNTCTSSSSCPANAPATCQ